MNSNVFQVLCLLLSVLSVTNAVTYKEIDITKTAGLGKEASAAADIVCDPKKFDAKELTNRHNIGQRAEQKFFDVIVPKLRGVAGKEAELKAVLCQKRRNKVMKSTCQMHANILFKFKDNGIEDQTKKRANNVRLTDVDCKGVDTKLYVDVKF